MGKVIILPETSEKPITLIGARAGICWGADISDAEKNYKRGLDCLRSGHGRTFEYVNVEVVLDGYSARVIREWYTHIGGAPTRLQASTRYINYADFAYVTPPRIEHSAEAKAIYDGAMQKISEAASRARTAPCCFLSVWRPRSSISATCAATWICRARECAPALTMNTAPFFRTSSPLSPPIPRSGVRSSKAK